MHRVEPTTQATDAAQLFEETVETEKKSNVPFQRHSIQKASTSGPNRSHSLPLSQVVASDIDNSLSVQRIVVVCKQGEKPHGKKQLKPLRR